MSELKAKLKELGGWPVVEGDKWNEKGFKWWELVKKGTDMGFLNGGFINVGIRVPLSPYRHYSCSHLSITDFVDELPNVFDRR